MGAGVGYPAGVALGITDIFETWSTKSSATERELTMPPKRTKKVERFLAGDDITVRIGKITITDEHEGDGAPPSVPNVAVAADDWSEWTLLMEVTRLGLGAFRRKTSAFAEIPTDSGVYEIRVYSDLDLESKIVVYCGKASGTNGLFRRLLEHFSTTTSTYTNFVQKLRRSLLNDEHHWLRSAHKLHVGLVGICGTVPEPEMSLYFDARWCLLPSPMPVVVEALMLHRYNYLLNTSDNDEYEATRLAQLLQRPIYYQVDLDDPSRYLPAPKRFITDGVSAYLNTCIMHVTDALQVEEAPASAETTFEDWKTSIMSSISPNMAKLEGIVHLVRAFITKKKLNRLGDGGREFEDMIHGKHEEILQACTLALEKFTKNAMRKPTKKDGASFLTAVCAPLKKQ